MIPKHIRRLLLLYFLETAYFLVGSGICVHEKNATKCCVNYAYNASLKNCVECVGKFGFNCSKECPDGFYGRSCNSKCNCSNETCNKIRGCLKSSGNEKDGICEDEEYGTYCCTNYRYLKHEHRCQECVGRFGVNCSQKCPEGYFGKQCSQNCTRNASQCDEMLGCLKTPSEFHRDGQSVLVLSSILQIVLPTSIAIGALLFCISLGCIYRFLKKKRIAVAQTYNITTTTANVEQEEYSGCAYAAVVHVHPKTKTLNARPRHDTTYGNAMPLIDSKHKDADLRTNASMFQETHILENSDTEYSKCSELEDLYDDTAYMA